MQMRIGGAYRHDSDYRASEFGRLRKDVVTLSSNLTDWDDKENVTSTAFCF